MTNEETNYNAMISIFVKQTDLYNSLMQTMLAYANLCEAKYPEDPLFKNMRSDIHGNRTALMKLLDENFTADATQVEGKKRYRMKGMDTTDLKQDGLIS